MLKKTKQETFSGWRARLRDAGDLPPRLAHLPGRDVGAALAGAAPAADVADLAVAAADLPVPGAAGPGVAGAAAAHVEDGGGLALVRQLALELLVEGEDGALRDRVRVAGAAAAGDERQPWLRERAHAGARRRSRRRGSGRHAAGGARHVAAAAAAG